LGEARQRGLLIANFVLYFFLSLTWSRHLELVGYVTSICRKASKRLVSQIMKWKIHRATGAESVDIANQKAKVIRGCINYYGKFRLYRMRPVFRALNLR